jgi:hypothetical protein
MPKGQIPWNKGKKGVQSHSDATKKKMSEGRQGAGNHRFGTHQSEESKRKNSDSNKKTHSVPEVRKKNSENIRKKYLDPEYVKNVKRGRINRSKNKLWHDKIVERNKTKQIEFLLGGFWYGNVRYPDVPKYCEKFNVGFKERVRAYWNYQCFECGELQNGAKHCVHHVHYDKKMCCNGSPQDVIPLCKQCHTKTNYNRDFWEDHFTELLYANDPNGKCFFTKKEYEKFII